MASFTTKGSPSHARSGVSRTPPSSPSHRGTPTRTRGSPSPQFKRKEISSKSTISPSEDLNFTVKKLLDRNSRLEDKIEELEGDKAHFQNKLEEYIRYDREQGMESEQKLTISRLEKHILELIAEKTNLQDQLVKRDRDISDLSASQHPHSGDRGQRVHLLQTLNEIQVGSKSTQVELSCQIELLKSENSMLREEVKWMRCGTDRRADEKASPYTTREMNHARHSTNTGYSSLPESLSYSSSSIQSSELPNVATLQLTSDPTVSTNSTAAELKKIKKQLEKYKTANIELDQKLKDARLELERYGEHRGEMMGYRMDLERFRQENAQLRSQLDRALGEISHLRSLVSRRY